MKYAIALLCCLALGSIVLAQSSGGIAGAVKDPSGAVIAGAKVTLASTRGGQPQIAVTNTQGAYAFRNVAPGTYTVTVDVSGFALYAKENVAIPAGQPQTLNITLQIAGVSQNVQVSADAPHVDIAPEDNTSTVTVSSKSLDALSDDPDELESELLALAGPSVGPNAGQIYVDGFTIDTEIPPKNSIREVRVNQDPFSAEYDRLGYGRIEIITKPGTNQLHGRLTVDGNDLSFDTRDPFATGEPGYYSFLGTADVSGPLSKNASYFLDYQHRNIVSDAIVNAFVLNSNQVQTPFAQTLAAPNTLDVVGPRLDYALSANNFLTLSFQMFRQKQQNLGVGQFALASQGYTLHSLQNVVRANDTQIVGTRFDNEIRFQGQDQSYSEAPASLAPEILVIGGFTGGGSTEGDLNYHHHHLEFDDIATYTASKHTFTFGGRIRTVREPYVSPGDFNGAYTFSSLSAYAAGTPRQFTLTVGNPFTQVVSEDTGVFFLDNWRARSNLMLSYGLRFETQNYIHDHADWVPRASIAYGIGRNPKTVVRAGFGLFYDRFSQQLQLQAMSLNGVRQTEYLVNDPTFYPSIPTAAELVADGAATTIYRTQPNLHSAYTIQSALGLERQVSNAVTVSVTYLNSIGNDQLISNNINSPLPGTYNPAIPDSGTRPDPSLGNVYEYESAAIFRQNQLITNMNVRASRGITLFGFYSLGKVQSDTGGAASFPDNPYDLNEDYGRASFDIRDRASLGGTFALPYGVLLSPLMNFQSGAPFNFTIGQDLLGSTIFDQRPAFATSSTPSADVVTTRYGSFNITPAPGEPLVPINAGTGPDNFVMNLRAGKTFGLGKITGEHAANGGGAQSSTNGAPSGGFRAGSTPQSTGGGSLGSRGLGDSVGSGGFAGSSNRRYSLTLSAEARNLFNEVNLAPPVGNVTSPLFGKSNGLAGGVYSFSGTNRRIDFQLALSF